jgi:hypothetical protein
VPDLSPFTYQLLKEIREAVGGSRGESLAWRSFSHPDGAQRRLQPNLP